MFLLRFRVISFFYLSNFIRLTNFLNKLVSSKSIETFENSIIVHNVKIICWIMNCHEIIKTFFSSYILPCFYCFLLSKFPNIIGSCTSMMAISNVCVRDFWKFAFKKVRILFGTFPQGMLYSIITNNISIGA